MKNMVLLAVDDKPENLFLIKELVAEYLPECEIITTQSPDEGLAIAFEKNLDGALIDVQMPVMDGIEMCRRLKANEATAHVPVVLVTAHKSTPELKVRGLEAGADDFLSKPIGNAELVAKIKVMLRIKRVEDELRNANTRLEQQVAERTRELKESEERFRIALAKGPITVHTQDRELRYTWVYNPHPGLTVESVLGKTDADLIPPDDAEPLTAMKRRVMESGEGERVEIRFNAGDAPSYYDLNLEPLRDDAGNVVGITGAATDITERKEIERERETTIKLLRLLNAKNDLHGLMRTILRFMKELSGCETVGIRLRDGDDFPYYETSGFSDEFVEVERRLCVSDLNGQLQRDEFGNPVLECMCGNIICGRFDPSKPFFTEHGSFVSNCTSELLASTTEEDRQSRTRNRCNAEGYESVALIPLRATGETFGLMQFNDRRKERFSHEFIALAERLADNVAIALAQRQAEGALRRQEEELRVIFDSVPAMVFYKDTENRLIRVNNALAKTCGKTKAELEGKPLSELYPELAEDYWRDDKEVMASGQPKTGILERLESPEGIRWVMTDKVPYRDGNGNIKGVIGFSVDITERKRAEEERQRLVAAVEQALEAIVITDVNGEIEYVNPSVERLMGYSQEEVVGKRPEAVFRSSKHDDEFYRKMWDTLSEGGVWQGAVAVGKKDGSILDTEMTVSPILNKEGEVINYVSVSRDVTHEHELEAQLLHSQKMEAIGTLAGGIAHDFNNILGAIMGFAELALEKAQPESNQSEYIKEVIVGSNRAKDLVKQILTFSRQVKSERKALRPDLMVKEALRMLQASIPSLIEFTQEIEPDSGLILADPTQFHQVIVNLCTNAYQAMLPAGGTLAVSLKTVNVDADFAALHPELSEGPHMQLVVKDTGAGMDEATLGRIFDPFFTTKEEGQGTGLGLSTVHGIVASMNGYISVASELGKGAAFTVYFPQIQGEEHRSNAESEPVPLGRGEYILVVDDEEPIRKITKLMLENLGYKVSACASAEEAFDLFNSTPEAFHMIITDFAMPKMSGAELLEVVRQIRPDIPVAIMTGLQETGVIEEAEALGLSMLLRKPVKCDELGRAIRKILDGTLEV